MEGMLAAALFVGIARAISVALLDGQVLDTILYSLATPLGHLPGLAAATLMVPAQALLHVPVPSVSGQAVLTMPVMAPLCDLLGMSRDAAVVAYQTGAGLMDLITPTNGALLAMLLTADVPYGRWLKFAAPGAVFVSLVGLVGVALARWLPARSNLGYSGWRPLLDAPRGSVDVLRGCSSFSVSSVVVLSTISRRRNRRRSLRMRPEPDMYCASCFSLY